MFSQNALSSNYYQPNKNKWIKNYTLFNEEKFWYKKSFANNTDDSRISELMYIVKLEVFIKSIH